jgi:hypothetical protein
MSFLFFWDVKQWCRDSWALEDGTDGILRVCKGKTGLRDFTET